jgi:hypothetical protein
MHCPIVFPYLLKAECLIISLSVYRNVHSKYPVITSIEYTDLMSQQSTGYSVARSYNSAARSHNGAARSHNGAAQYLDSATSNVM